MLYFALRRIVATAVTFITIKTLTSEPVRRMGNKLYRKVTGHSTKTSSQSTEQEDYDPVTGEFYTTTIFNE